MSLHAFVDESVAGAYIVAVALVRASEVAAGRRLMRGLLTGGQKRMHFYQESDRRRSKILKGIEELGPEFRVYLTKKRKHARDACLERMIPDLVAADVRRLVIERDESLVLAERRLLYQLTRDDRPGLEYVHLRAKEDLLLCLPDAIAWCWSRGGGWRERVAAYTTEIAL
ncbi:hypothetical protein [Jiangella mangrovi]|uniref:DUF3800 domain-containing protein n=1 Tax=Jiangella mangrovi TaxID=1524084 RepID=A0A7W9GTF4_9ACTN|nr:hypothetical protein [Jiangella mangrovi]MBB5789708.1 hypothetical protein [Jiangella mangrovi]